MGPFGIKAEDARDTDVGRERRPTYHRRPSPRVAAGTGAAPDSKFENRLRPPGFDDARCLGGDQGRVVQMIEQRRLEDLAHDHRALHDRDRSVGMHYPALGNCPHDQFPEVAVGLQPLEERLVVERRSGGGAFRSHELDGRRVESGLLHPIEQPFQTGRHGVTGLMAAVVGIRAEVVVELGVPLV